MIIVKLIGGLGNQMFQYAAGRQLAYLHQTDLLVDISHLEKDPNGAYTKRNLELSVFNLDLKIASQEDIKKFNIERSTKYSRALQRHLPVLFTNLYAAESGTLYQKEFLNYPKNTYLDGFWQSERYFKSIESVLLKEFTPKDKLDSENKNWLNKINSCESVSLHIRRGDYVSSKNAQEHHGNLGLDYYINALKRIKETYSDIEVFVFSDDLEWCKANLKIDDTIHYVDANQKQHFHLDMYLMSHCKHNVIANSSFSWWAAWLNRNKHKIVIAPINWFADKSLNTKDLIPTFMDHSLNHISPVVSVVMSVYNGETYLREAIDSVLNQTFTDFEFIIINDGSSDNSLSIIKSYTDKRIVLIDNNGNKGLIYSLNKGIEASKGKYIARMDADDLCLPERFKKQVDYLESHSNVGVVGCDYLSFNKTKSTLVTSIYKSNEIKSFLLFTATMCHPTLMLRKQVLTDNHLSYSENAKHVEDYDLWSRMVLYTDFYNLNEVLFKYRDHAQQVSHQYRDIQLKNSHIVQENYLKNLGFVFSQVELETHFLIASNIRIQTKENLIRIEQWLWSLIDQNVAKKIIAEDEFKSTIHKMWLDCCGNTNLGLWAYRYYQTSPLKKITGANTSFNAKLLAKSIVRWIK